MNFVSVRQRLLRQRRFRKILVICLALSLAMAFMIVPLEQSVPGSSIRNLSDGLWWSIQTLTTVGYGDTVPVTDLGRFLGVLMQLVGAIGFGVLIAMVSTSMSRNQEEYYWTRLFERIDTLDERLSNLEKNAKFLVEQEREELTKLDKDLRLDSQRK